MGLKIGIVGSTGFARSFIPLFQAHPLVDEVIIAELHEDKRNQIKNEFKVHVCVNSLEHLCKTDVDAIAIFTQRHLHAEHTLEVLDANKHVYCAVPMATSISDIQKIIDKVKEKNLIYMTGETSFYYPCTLFCKSKFQSGEMGKIVYAEACYMHDMSHEFYDAFKSSGGELWKSFAGFPPMYYSTHSVSCILSVTNQRIVNVSCFGLVDEHEDAIFRAGANLWDNPFSNQTALMQSSDGSIIRINEFRRVGWIGEEQNSVHMSMFGTLGSYEEQANAKVWTTLQKEEMTDLKALLKCKEKYVPELDNFYRDCCDIHPIECLPKEYASLTNGHGGSHQFLTNEFITSVYNNVQPQLNVIKAANFAAPGIIAHESSLRNGIMMEVPDFGEEVF